MNGQWRIIPIVWSLKELTWSRAYFSWRVNTMGGGVWTEQIDGFKGVRFGMGPDNCKCFVPPR